MAGRRHQRRQAAEQLRRPQGEDLAAVAEGTLEPVGEAAVRERREPLQRERRTRSVAAELLQPFAVVGVQVHAGVEGESLEESGVPSPPQGLLRRSRKQEGFCLRARQRVGLFRLHRLPSRMEERQQADHDAPEDRLHLGIGRRSERDEADGAFLADKHSIRDDAMEMDVQVKGAAKALHGGSRRNRISVRDVPGEARRVHRRA